MNFLRTQIDVRFVALIRILAGIWFFVDVVSMLVSGYVKEAYVSSKLNLSFYGFEWLQALPGIGMYILFVLLAFVSVAIIIGYRPKLFLTLFIIAFTYVFLIDVVYTLNKFYLFLLIAGLLLSSDQTTCWTYPNFRKCNEQYAAYWNVFIFQALLCIIYFYSGIAKINHDWLYHAEPLHSFFQNRSYLRALGKEGIETMSYMFSFAGITFDLSIAFILINKKTRFWGQLAQATFHTLNFSILHIGSLSIFMALFTFFLFPTDWLKRKMKLREPVEATTTFEWNGKVILAFIILAAQLIVPHRHYVSGHNVNWTEKGHRFSWRLMSRTKGGSRSNFTVVDNESGERWNINPVNYLTGRQYRKMSAESDLLLFFGHYLEKEWNAKGYKDVSVYVNSKTRLNHRRPSAIISPEIDLTKVSRTFLVDKISDSMAPCHIHDK